MHTRQWADGLGTSPATLMIHPHHLLSCREHSKPNLKASTYSWPLRIGIRKFTQLTRLSVAAWDNRRVSFRYPITVSGPYGAYTVEAVVDPDATFTAVPEPALVEMGIDPVRVVQLRDARGSKRFYRLGRALVTVAGVEDLAPVLFIEAGEPTVIGATTLALLMLEPDEASRTVVQIVGRVSSIVDEAVG